MSLLNSVVKKPKQVQIEDLPWCEKYRPKTIDAVVHQTEVVSVLRKTISGSDFPNLLFYGPPGTGKTSTILAAARELFGDIYYSRILELNASDERGIQVVRNKIKKFAQNISLGVKSDGTPCPAYKLIILDEADSMTTAAQAALRRTMESETRTTRFCLICNYISRILPAISSRCAKFRFKPISTNVAVKKLEEICKMESICVPTDEDPLKLLIESCNGDLRQAITLLQNCSYLVSPDDSLITKEIVFQVIGTVPISLIEDIVVSIKKNNFDSLVKQTKKIFREGYSGYQILNQFFEALFDFDFFDDNQKSKIFEKIGTTDACLTAGANEYLQILSVFSEMMTIAK